MLEVMNPFKKEGTSGYAMEQWDFNGSPQNMDKDVLTIRIQKTLSSLVSHDSAEGGKSRLLETKCCHSDAGLTNVRKATLKISVL